jgi:RimJ/RimL family protein N-acetyltransferase
MTGTDLHIPTIETARLRLRAPCMADFTEYAAFRGSERARVLGGPYSRADAFDQLSALIGHWALRGFGRWMVADRETDAPLGVVGLYHPDDWPEPEIGWQVFGAAEGRGVAYEAAMASRDYAYAALGWKTVVSLILPTNTRSAALARRMGAVVEGTHLHASYGTLEIWRHRGPEALA